MRVNMTTCLVPDVFLHNSSNSTQCFQHDVVNQQFFTFDDYQLGRVIVTWVVFVLSVTGNVFVLVSIGTQRAKWENHVIMMFNVALADLFYACTVLPIDGVWNMTMQWYGGDGMCRISQMLKQMGMYSSANMVMVIGIHRAWTIKVGILYSTKETKRIKILVRAAWAMSLVCSVPAGVFFSTCQIVTCEETVFTQCVDNVAFPPKYLHSYHFFTMVMSFILPVIGTIISGLVIVNELKRMKGNTPCNGIGKPGEDIKRSINTTTNMKTAVVLTFLLCWTPYYAIGIIYWFGLEIDLPEAAMLVIYRIPYMLMYLNCFLHPIIFGLYMKKVKRNFVACLRPFKKKMRFSKGRSTSQASNEGYHMNLIQQHKTSVSNEGTKFTTTDDRPV